MAHDYKLSSRHELSAAAREFAHGEDEVYEITYNSTFLMVYPLCRSARDSAGFRFFFDGFPTTDLGTLSKPSVPNVCLRHVLPIHSFIHSCVRHMLFKSSA